MTQMKLLTNIALIMLLVKKGFANDDVVVENPKITNLQGKIS